MYKVNEQEEKVHLVEVIKKLFQVPQQRILFDCLKIHYFCPQIFFFLK